MRLRIIDLKIAPYLATNIQRSYLRQQRIGERIAELKGTDESAATQPAAQVDIPEAVLKTSRTGRSDLAKVRDEQLEQLADRFAKRFIETFFQGSGGAEAEEEVAGRPSFGRILENLGIAVHEESGGEGGLVVRQENGHVLLHLPPESREEAAEELKKLARDILQDLI
jgi:hypothetical protein